MDRGRYTPAQPHGSAPLGQDAATRMMRYDAGKRSVGVAYLLWLCLGSLGAHRFYLGSVGIGLLTLCCTGLAFLTFGLTGVVSGVILLWDLFTIPGKVRLHNERLIAELEHFPSHSARE